jgi:hypothetical protein
VNIINIMNYVLFFNSHILYSFTLKNECVVHNMGYIEKTITLLFIYDNYFMGIKFFIKSNSYI